MITKVKKEFSEWEKQYGLKIIVEGILSWAKGTIKKVLGA